jgi:hypothetical protein
MCQETGPGRIVAFTADSPQTRHNAKKSEAENGGIMRITAGSPFVAKIAVYARVLESIVR